MKFAKIVFLLAGIWGVLVLTPLYFLYDRIGVQGPPPITHPCFYYGFVAVALAWQAAFLVIASDPVRLRPVMIPAMLEKFGYVATVTTLFLEQRMKAPDMALAAIDGVLGILFVMAWMRTGQTGH